MDYIEAIKARLRNSAKGIVRELEHSHGAEGLSISVKETAKSITVTIKVSSVVVDEQEADGAEVHASGHPMDYLDK